MRWSLCYLEGARLPIHSARRYAGLLGVEQLDPIGMLAMFLAQPGARCLRSLTLDLGLEHAHCQQVLELVARCQAPLETLVIWVALLAVPVTRHNALDRAEFARQRLPVLLPGDEDRRVAEVGVQLAAGEDDLVGVLGGDDDVAGPEGWKLVVVRLVNEAGRGQQVVEAGAGKRVLLLDAEVQVGDVDRLGRQP